MLLPTLKNPSTFHRNPLPLQLFKITVRDSRWEGGRLRRGGERKKKNCVNFWSVHVRDLRGDRKRQRLKDCMFTRVAVTRGAQTSITHLFNKLPCSGPSNDGVWPTVIFCNSKTAKINRNLSVYANRNLSSHQPKALALGLTWQAVFRDTYLPSWNTERQWRSKPEETLPRPSSLT